jgi:ribosome-binding protein aMBF1 (putative translation factor)
MSKSKSRARKSERKQPNSATKSRKSYRSTVVGTIDTLPIVESDFGRALKLRARLDMNRETFARLVPMSTRNLANIESGKAPSPTILRQLKELRRVVDALSEVIQKNAIGPWLVQPNEAFGGLKPIEVIERGEIDRIWQMIFYLRSGVAS